MEKASDLHHVKIEHEYVRKNRRKKVSWRKRIILGILAVFILLIGIYTWTLISAGNSVFTNVFSIGENIKSDQGRVNILLLGLAGGKHDGALLTDSIIIASYNLDNNHVTLISIPRDLWLDNIDHKVNAAYEFGLLDKNGGDGLKFAEDKIDDILGLPIHYGIRIDFGGFVKAVDLVDGLDIDVPKTFEDFKYPIEGKENDLCDYTEQEVEFTQDQLNALSLPSPLPTHLKNFGPEPVQPGKKKVLIAKDGKVATEEADFSCRYEHISFTKGVTHMDGQTALKFVRSRMGTNGEGSDFARSRRQQVVLEAFRAKVLSIETLANPVKITGLINTLGESVETDIPADKIGEFYKLVKDMGPLQSIVLGDLGNGKSMLINPPVSQYGQWVLTVPDGDFSLLQAYIEDKLKQQDASGSATRQGD